MGAPCTSVIASAEDYWIAQRHINPYAAVNAVHKRVNRS